MKPKIILIPGNGNTDVEKHNWYAWVKKELQEKGYEVLAHNMPDPELARSKFWLPYIENELNADENSILIGHSSGAIAIQRYAETHQILGAILVGTYHTDLGYEEEKISGYFDTPWQWGKIKKNCQWIVQLAGQDDPYISKEESRFVHEHLDCEYHEYTDQGHFGDPDHPYNDFPALIEIIERKEGGGIEVV